MLRVVETEQLDGLAAGDPWARRARRDLRRVNWWMGNASHLAQLFREAALRAPPRRLIDLGTGDGTLLLQVAKRLPAWGQRPELWAVDRCAAFEPCTRAAFADLGWQLTCVQADVRMWLNHEWERGPNWLVTNLFLHHFSPSELESLLSLAADRADGLCACEPRRSALAWVASRGLGLLGASSITRQDAALSVRAGFVGVELSQLWPTRPGWRLVERSAGWFSHLFLAQRLT